MEICVAIFIDMKKILILLLSIISLSVFSQTTNDIRQDTIKHVAKGNDTKLYHSANKYELETNKDSFNFNKPIFVNGMPVAGGNPDSLYHEYSATWLLNGDTITTQDTATYALNASTDSLYHDDTDTWLSNGDTIPRSDSVRLEMTATNKLTTDSIYSENDIVLYSGESLQFNFGGNTYTYDGAYFYDDSDTLAKKSDILSGDSDSSWVSATADTLNVSDVGKIYKSGSSEITIESETNTDMAITSDRDLNITSEQLYINTTNNPATIYVGTNSFNIQNSTNTYTTTGDTAFWLEENLKAKTVTVGDSLRHADGSWTTATNQIEDVIPLIEFTKLQTDTLLVGDDTITEGSKEMSLYIFDGSITLTVTQDEYAVITGWTEGYNQSNYFTVLNDSVQLVAGDYAIEYDLSYSGTNTDVNVGGIFLDGVMLTTGGGFERGMSGSDSGVIGVSWKGTISSTVYVSFRITNTANSNDPTIYYGNVSIRKIN